MAKKKKRSVQATRFADSAQTARLIEQCRKGDTAAEEVIFARYVNRLTALARSRLSRRLAARFDPSDVVMSAYRSFFIGLRERGFVISNDAELWQLLLQITLRKVYRQAARHSAAKRAAGRDVSLQLSDGSVLAVPSREPRPEEALAIAEELELLLRPLPPAARRIVELRLQGEEIIAISREIGVNERTVRRWLDRIKQLLSTRRDQVAADGPKRAIPIVPHDANGLERRQGSLIERRARSSTTALPTSLPELQYGDFVLQRMIGAGTNGKIYRALRRRDGRYYALKFLRKSFIGDRAAVGRFLEESALVARFRHPNILPVLGCGRTPRGGYFFAMNLALSDLERRLRRGRIAVKQAVEWLLHAALGVQYAHDRGVIHRDLKPSNLLLLHEGRVVVADFGLACRLDEPLHSLQLAGTPAFMAPEQVTSSKGISPRTDVYGLGATLYALLTGRSPFVGDRASDVLSQVISAAPLAISAVRPRLPAEIGHACMQCLEKNPADRFSSVNELIEALTKRKL
jgi:eukaryotic-like serine/threonine-protein kinase